MNPIDSIRGIFALLIVWHHYHPIHYHYNFGDTIVLFFFILSGFHIAITWKDKIQNSSCDFIIRRCAKIFPLQWLTVALHIIFDVNIVLWWVVPFHLTLTQSLNPMWQSYFSINSPSWFLSSLFICYLCTPVILNLAREKIYLFFCLLICAIALCVLSNMMLPDNIGRRWLFYISPLARILDYSTGIMLGLFYNNRKTYLENKIRQFKRITARNWKCIFTVLEIIFVFLMLFTMVYEPFFRYNSYTSLRYPIVGCFIILFTIHKGYVSELLSNRWFAWLGSVSMSVYMIHFLILHFVQEITNIPLWTHIIVTYTCILFASYYINKMLPYLSDFFIRTINKIYSIVSYL